MPPPVSPADPGAGHPTSADVTTKRPVGPADALVVSTTARLSPASPYRPASANSTRKARMSRFATWRLLLCLTLRALTSYPPRSRAHSLPHGQYAARTIGYRPSPGHRRRPSFGRLPPAAMRYGRSASGSSHRRAATAQVPDRRPATPVAAQPLTGPGRACRFCAEPAASFRGGRGVARVARGSQDQGRAASPAELVARHRGRVPARRRDAGLTSPAFRRRGHTPGCPAPDPRSTCQRRPAPLDRRPRPRPGRRRATHPTPSGLTEVDPRPEPDGRVTPRRSRRAVPRRGP